MYVVKNSSDQQLVIDGLGVLAPGEELRITDAEVEWFQTLRGIPFDQDALPEAAVLNKLATKKVDDAKKEQ